MNQLSYLPLDDDWQKKLAEVPADSSAATWEKLRNLANSRLDFTTTLRLDRALQKRFSQQPPTHLHIAPIRLAILGSCSVEHLVPGIRVAGLRRGLWITTFLGNYGQYRQELLDENSPLYAFQPNAILLSLDSRHLLGGLSSAREQSAQEICEKVIDDLQPLWKRAREAFRCQIIQQTVLPVSQAIMGQNEHRLPSSLLNLTYRLNELLTRVADEAGINLLTLDKEVLHLGLQFWHDPLLWNKAKQEISPNAGPAYGDLVARVLAAARGGSAKCLVMDLDNTLWGGVIGDDGLEGIKLGQGSATGEAFLAIQRYALDLSRRGVVLAVCSKNDESNALLPFEKHPEMLLKCSDIACFIANWQDKAANIRTIAQRLNLSLEALVFLDDNPFERNQVRMELPMVNVPELPQDPALYPHCLAEAGYFEAVSLTAEDLNRSQQYAANQQREELKTGASDIKGYLTSLSMKLHWGAFTQVDLKRVVQLVQKTNQFNLTTRRYTEAEVQHFMKDPGAMTLQFRLTDRFGDNGIIGLIIAVENGPEEMRLETWLMSCRVLGRGVERAMHAVLMGECKKRGVLRLIGEYRPTTKNGMVADHYRSLGFDPLPATGEEHTLWRLEIGLNLLEPGQPFTFLPAL